MRPEHAGMMLMHMSLGLDLMIYPNVRIPIIEMPKPGIIPMLELMK